MTQDIKIFEFASDNFGFLLHEPESARTISIDAGDEQAILHALQQTGWTLTDLLITHHHFDHTDAILPLKDRFQLTVTGPREERTPIRGLDATVKDGDRISFGSIEFEVIGTPGHTLGHVSYHDPARKNLFCGDALFSLGCGRMFEGTPGPMWQGLKRLRALPDETVVFCGHDYGAANARFALSIDPDNARLRERSEEIDRLIDQGRPAVPFNLGQDKHANPFLNADDPEMAERMGMKGAAPEQVFAAIRKAKDDF